MVLAQKQSLRWISCHGATKSMSHNCWACALEPASHNYWAWVPQLLELPIKAVREGILVLFLILQEMLLSFHHWVWCYLLAYHVRPLLWWGMFPLYLFCGVFITNGCWILSEAFSACTEMIVWFLFFNFLMWCMTLIDLQILKLPCIPGVNPTWSWCMILLMYCWIWFAIILLRIFESVFISDIDL